MPPKSWKRAIPNGGTWIFKLHLSASGHEEEGEAEEQPKVSVCGNAYQQQPGDDVPSEAKADSGPQEHEATGECPDAEKLNATGGFPSLLQPQERNPALDFDDRRVG